MMDIVREFEVVGMTNEVTVGAVLSGRVIVVVALELVEILLAPSLAQA